MALGDSKKKCDSAVTNALQCSLLELKYIYQSVANGNSSKSCGNSPTMPRKWSRTLRARTNYGSFTNAGTLILPRDDKLFCQ